MSAIYDNWERLVGAVLKKQQLWQLFHSDSVSPSLSSDSSGFSFSASLDDVPFSFPNPNHAFPANPTPNNLVLDESLPLPPIKKGPPRKRDLRIEVPKFRIQDLGCSSDCRPSSRANPKGGGIHSNDAEQQSYPLPLPPGAKSKSAPVSTANSPSPPSQRAENVNSLGTSWKKGKLIGRGLLGNVYLGFNSEKGEMCAMKEARLLVDADMKRVSRTLEIEIALLSRMKHPNIVQYFATEMVGDNFYVYLEYVSGGSIHTILQEYGKLGELAIRNYTQQILAGLAYLHSNKFVHGNIKAASILVDPNGGVKLSNFFVEKHIAGKPKESLLMHSPYWMAPEVISNSTVRNSASDIWSLGCTVLEMATSKPPLGQYKGAMAMFKVACKNEGPAIPDHLSDVCKDFLRCCLQWSPLHRATASQLLEHPFIRNSSPSGKQLLVSSSSVYPVVTNAVKSEGTVYSTSPRMLGSGEVACQSMASKSSLHSRDIYSPRNIGSPQQLMSPSRSPPPKMSSPSYWDPNILHTLFRFS